MEFKLKLHSTTLFDIQVLVEQVIVPSEYVPEHFLNLQEITEFLMEVNWWNLCQTFINSPK